ncbi:calcium-binding and coiled-coil domain-containing protein 2 [Ahaetulla prasina]|uniref:calcium-binding and coiled-coil domain-containing protein 2 n=1 Tax=Ahaetulla prasina TaxID=499056 RepID=UPI00264A0C3D|nr:calcium-binding and coiled-coil domain-containing protein 2 [Ahaetulla prasina]
MEDKFYSCNNLEEPPTSAVMSENCSFSQVVFVDVKKFYAPEKDVTCYYNISQSFIPSKNDWVGIFKVGWKATREYFTFIWAPELSDSESGYAEQQKVLFKAYYLPKDDEYYQFCYVDQDGQIHGASVPFQFRDEAKDDIPVVTKEGEGEKIKQQNETLLQENDNLKKNLASLQEKNVHLQEELVAAKTLQDKVNTLEDKCEKLESQNKDLEKEKNAIKEDLMQIKIGKESALSQKEQLENLLKTTLHQKEEFQLQVHMQQKEIDNLQDRIKDKVMDLEELKGENYQLNAALFRQQMLNNLQEEQTLTLQILKKQKDDLEHENQKLWRENEMLRARLPAIRSPPPGFLLSQSPPNSELLFRNPFSAPPEMDPVPQKKCPICEEVFPNDIEQQQYLDHVQNHILECPFCDLTFRSSEKQVYNDHVFCHCLDQD